MSRLGKNFKKSYPRITIQDSGPKIGIFGGTFDPIHRGHLKLLCAARQLLGLDRIFVVPSYRTPLKDAPSASAVHRLAMLRLALKPFSWAQISLFETTRRRVSYTVDTLRYFKRRFPASELYLIVGADAARNFARWKNPDGILKLCRVAVAPRGRALSSWLRRGFVALPMPRVPESSTAARRAVARGASLQVSVPPGVVRYVKVHGLYGVRCRKVV